MSISVGDNLRYLCHDKLNIIDRMVANKQFNLCIFFSYNKNAAVHVQVNPSPEDIDQLKRFFDDHILGDINHKTVLGKHSVVSHYAIAGIIAYFRVIPFNNIGMSF
ncbi:hypothetical protein SDC9_84277 [bioreactor metagenome]|uniref:Uncharacterized protein n=1 Tax=bioreactor metagenome TaxID=1076179 RepID=A0A644ZBK0_9ZZZZ